MRPALALYPTLLLTVLTTAWGCAVRQPDVHFASGDLAHYERFATQIEYPDVQSCTAPCVAATPAPITLADRTPPQFRGLTLREAIETALNHADVLRDLRGLVLASPGNLTTIADPAIINTDPTFGEEAALSAFDAMFEMNAYFEKNDRALNNQFLGGGTRLLRQDLHLYQAQISKRSASGTDFTLRHNVQYDFNNAPGNNSPHLPWDVNVEAEVRQPLLQGAGVEFNRIAGPDSEPGRARGVLIARINTDISLADFEAGVRDFVYEVESAYWELYFAYRDLDARIAARDQALETWRQISTWQKTGRSGGEAQNELQAREQYFRMQEEVENALSGQVFENLRYENFRGISGVHAAERRLRLLMGLPINEGILLRPADEPAMAEVVFEWDEILTEGLVRRVELRRQKWQIKRRELELVAAKNYLKPRLDAVGRYRWRGLGHDLLNPDGGTGGFDNAYGTLTGGDFQEWQLGVELTAPLGFRQAHAAVRNAELMLARERAVLSEQERSVSHDLSSAYAELQRAYLVSQTNYNRRLAAREQLLALRTAVERADHREKTRLLDLLLDAQRRLADAESRYYRSIVEYTLAVTRVHLQKGSLLDYCEIYLAEGPWPGKAYYDACRRDRLRSAPLCLADYRMMHAPVVSQGEYAQQTESDLSYDRSPADERNHRLPPVPAPAGVPELAEPTL